MLQRISSPSIFTLLPSLPSLSPYCLWSRAACISLCYLIPVHPLPTQPQRVLVQLEVEVVQLKRLPVGHVVPVGLLAPMSQLTACADEVMLVVKREYPIVALPA